LFKSEFERIATLCDYDVRDYMPTSIDRSRVGQKSYSKKPVTYTLQNVDSDDHSTQSKEENTPDRTEVAGPIPFNMDLESMLLRNNTAVDDSAQLALEIMQLTPVQHLGPTLSPDEAAIRI
jgi:hypothetical protein